jgi:hypothetical protein
MRKHFLVHRVHFSPSQPFSATPMILAALQKCYTQKQDSESLLDPFSLFQSFEILRIT